VVFVCSLIVLLICVFFLVLQYFDTVGWVFSPVKPSPV